MLLNIIIEIPIENDVSLSIDLVSLNEFHENSCLKKNTTWLIKLNNPIVDCEWLASLWVMSRFVVEIIQTTYLKKYFFTIGEFINVLKEIVDWCVSGSVDENEE